MNDKLLTLIGFAAKAGKLSYGMSAAVSAVKAGKSRLVLVCCDISPKSQKEITFQCNKKSVSTYVLDDYDIQSVSDAVGRNCGIISVNDSSFADALSEQIKGGNANDK